MVIKKIHFLYTMLLGAVFSLQAWNPPSYQVTADIIEQIKRAEFSAEDINRYMSDASLSALESNIYDAIKENRLYAQSLGAGIVTVRESDGRHLITHHAFYDDLCPRVLQSIRLAISVAIDMDDASQNNNGSPLGSKWAVFETKFNAWRESFQEKALRGAHGAIKYIYPLEPAAEVKEDDDTCSLSSEELDGLGWF
jgi:hypothetical protein